MAKTRIKKEINDLFNNPNEMFTAAPKSDDDLFTWEATMTGPPDTPYEGGVFKLHIKLSENYPFEAPRFTFQTKIYHVNIR